MNNFILNAYFKVKSGIHHILHEEKGASEVIASVVILGIVLALAFLFMDNITQIAKDLWGWVADPTTEKPELTAPKTELKK